MTRTKSEGFKLAKKFMNAKDIMKVKKNLLNNGYGIKEKTNDTGRYSNYPNILEVCYLEKQSFLLLQVFYKDNPRYPNDPFKQEVQTTYYY